MKISKDNKTKLNITFTMIALALIALATATYAWFSLSLSTKVNTIDMQVTAGSYLKFDTKSHGSNIEDYTSELDNAAIEVSANHKLADIKLAPLTSEDGKTLYDQGGKGHEVLSTTTNFLQFDLYFIGSTDMDVYLTEENSADGNDGTDFSTKETGGKADVIKAVRVSFEPEGGSSSIYEPHKSGGTTLKVLNAGTQNTFDKADITNSDALLFSLNALTPKKVTVRVWIEGDDAECKDAIINATFMGRLRFEGKEK